MHLHACYIHTYIHIYMFLLLYIRRYTYSESFKPHTHHLMACSCWDSGLAFAPTIFLLQNICTFPIPSNHSEPLPTRSFKVSLLAFEFEASNQISDLPDEYFVAPGASNMLGRACAGAMASVECVNILHLNSLCLMAAGVCTMAVVFCQTFEMLIVYCVVFGFIVGEFSG